MSIRTNKMKAVGVLMKQLTTSRRKFHEKGRDESFDGELEKLRLVLNNIKDVFVEVKKNEEKLLDTLAEVYDHLRKLDRRKLNEDMHNICKSIKDSALTLLPMLVFDDSNNRGDKISHSSEELVQSHQKESWTLEHMSWSDLHDLNLLKDYLCSLLVFLPNVVIRKRNAINLWIGEGLIKNTEKKTAEKLGEDVLANLLKLKVIVSYGSRKDPIVNKFQISPHVRSQLKTYFDKELKYLKPSRLLLELKKVTVDGVDENLLNIFNIGASYLNFKPQWITDELKNLEVLQLGRWQDSALHHIEVGSQEFLRELRTLKHLKYLSLRGISRIFELPSSIAELESLLILDLKACHNLERLPDDISSMKSLTHLIMSDCCLLEGMPKGIEKLTNLQVLKGFLISTSEKTPCRISDLRNLIKLRRLSINIGREAMIKDGEFESLKYFSALQHLKISWSTSDLRYAQFPIYLPKNLTKLHLECFPGRSLLEFFCAEDYKNDIKIRYTIPRELHVTGGKLQIINDIRMPSVEILRLKYLKQLNVDIDSGGAVSVWRCGAVRRGGRRWFRLRVVGRCGCVCCFAAGVCGDTKGAGAVVRGGGSCFNSAEIALALVIRRLEHFVSYSIQPVNALMNCCGYTFPDMVVKQGIWSTRQNVTKLSNMQLRNLCHD
ncbi:uncharacterized protein LOC106776602 [Vigna radiata var. radiata]|uniref:Uncharacterized protein LOC106776602 n=1 Tax=Vigna radiata var. radiata TaxID=3916 RepID=A0A1S3VMQ1_VIGRR|nr:uncharacterized protein LOC106776602 [Vigna radiata var. radiata]